MKKAIYEILEEVAKAKGRDEKQKVLLKNNCLALRDILKGAFDDAIVFNLPVGEPPYKKDLDDRSHEAIHHRTKLFKYFVKGGEGDRVLPAKREKMFIEILEVVHNKDAEILCLMKDKNLKGKYNGLTKKLISETFPGIIVR